MPIKRILFLLLLLPVTAGCALTIPVRAAAIPEKPIQGLYRGVFHVHSEFSSDSLASLDTIIETAKKAKLDFVVITDHDNRDGQAAYDEGNFPERPLLIFGEEITTEDGHLISIGVDEKHPDELSTQELVDWIHSKGGYSFLSHPVSPRRPWGRWEIERVDGMEIYNFPHELFAAGKLEVGTELTFLPPRFFLKSFQEMPEPSLYKWDLMARKKPMVAISAVDAHIRKDWFGYSPENFLLQFQSSTLYIQALELTRETVIHSLGRGRSFVSFEARGAAQDFEFYATVDDHIYLTGETLVSWRPVTYTVTAPGEATIRLIRDGSVIAEHHGKRLDHIEELPGTYRAEVTLKGRPWVLSNSIYAE